MNQLTPDARLRLDVYMNGVRRAVAGTSVDPEEVERDIREHIETALKQTATPVSRATLDEVLARLGDPSQWVPDEEIPQWRRVWRRFAYGPEEWRLPYLAFALTILGLLTIPVGIGVVFIGAAWILSRAALRLPSVRPENDAARRWLLYPSIIFVSVVFALMILAGPVPPVLVWGIEERGFADVMQAGRLGHAEMIQLNTAFTLAAFAAWWIVLAALVAALPRAVRWLFAPLADRLRRRHALVLAAIAIVMAVTAFFLLPIDLSL